MKTFLGWAEQQLPDGTVIWTLPDGHTYVSTPGQRVHAPRAQNRAHRIATERRQDHDAGLAHASNVKRYCHRSVGSVRSACSALCQPMCSWLSMALQ
jgi:hypothetical protein